MSRYAARPRPQRRAGEAGQAAEPSADFDELEAEAEAVLLEPLDARAELDPLDEEPLEDSLLDPLDEPESLEPLGAGTEAEELLRESVR